MTDITFKKSMRFAYFQFVKCMECSQPFQAFLPTIYQFSDLVTYTTTDAFPWQRNLTMGQINDGTPSAI